MTQPEKYITKTCLFKYTDNTTKQWKFLDKKNDILMFLLKT